MSKKKETLTGQEEVRGKAKRRLERNLACLESYCQAEGAGCWPPRELLNEIRHDVLVIAKHKRKGRIWPDWEAFELVDKLKKLELETRVNALIDRARAILPGGSIRPDASEFGKTVLHAMRGDAKAQCSLRDKVLKAGNPAELFWEYRQEVQQQCNAEPLVSWLAKIRHPLAKDFGMTTLGSLEEIKAEDRREHKRYKTRERVRRWREVKKIRRNSVTTT